MYAGAVRFDRPLADDGEPLDTEPTDGRFLACTPQFYPRGVYERQDVTVAGTLEPPGPASGVGSAGPLADGSLRSPKSGRLLAESGYRYPRVAIATLNFWPQRHDSLSERYGSRWWQPPDQGSQGYWW